MRIEQQGELELPSQITKDALKRTISFLALPPEEKARLLSAFEDGTAASVTKLLTGCPAKENNR